MTEQQPGLKVGDRVKWGHVSHRGKVYSWSLRTGTIEAIEGEVAQVRYGKKTLCEVRISELNEDTETVQTLPRKGES